MIYEVKKPILGFENVLKVEFEEIDGLFATLRSVENEVPNFTLVNPYQLREYSFDIPKDVEVLLDIKPESKLLVYNVVVLHNPITESIVNFKAPFIFNQDNHTMAQFIIKGEELASIGELLKEKNGTE